MSGILRTIGEVGLGLLFLVGAIFNIGYTIRHGEEFYGSFARECDRDGYLPGFLA